MPQRGRLYQPDIVDAGVGTSCTGKRARRSERLRYALPIAKSQDRTDSERQAQELLIRRLTPRELLP